MPSPGIFFSLRQDTGWFSAAARVDWMAFSEPTGLMLLSARFQGPCQLPTPSSEAVAFSPQKGTTKPFTLRFSLGPALQCTLWFFSSSALRHFPSAPRASWEQCNVCVLTVTACGPETLSQILLPPHMGWSAHLTCSDHASSALAGLAPSAPLLPAISSLLPHSIPTSSATFVPVYSIYTIYTPCRIISTHLPSHAQREQ